LAFLTIAAPLYLLQFAIAMVTIPRGIAPDPFTLFPFALVLGYLYYRTHRIVPSMALHLALNGTSLLLAWILL
jgi:membrane protease YdiL (CAAX protease family)